VSVASSESLQATVNLCCASRPGDQLLCRECEDWFSNRSPRVSCFGNVSRCAVAGNPQEYAIPGPGAAQDEGSPIVHPGSNLGESNSSSRSLRSLRYLRRQRRSSRSISLIPSDPPMHSRDAESPVWVSESFKLRVNGQSGFRVVMTSSDFASPRRSPRIAPMLGSPRMSDGSRSSIAKAALVALALVLFDLLLRVFAFHNYLALFHVASSLCLWGLGVFATVALEAQATRGWTVRVVESIEEGTGNRVVHPEVTPPLRCFEPDPYVARFVMLFALWILSVFLSEKGAQSFATTSMWTNTALVLSLAGFLMAGVAIGFSLASLRDLRS
jgi:hypothetical protein